MTGAELGQPGEAELRQWIRAVGDVTTPLLAGFSVASVIVVSDDAGNFRWPGATILVLAIAAITLIAAVQCAYHTRLYLSADPKWGARWAAGTRIFYHSGIVALLAGLGLALAPQHGSSTEAGLRWSAMSITLLACAGESIVIILFWVHRRRQQRGQARRSA